MEGLQEISIAVVVVVVAIVVAGVLVGGQFLQCVPIGRTASGPHPHLSLNSTHHCTETK